MIATLAVVSACGTADAAPRTLSGDARPLQAGDLTARDVATAQTAFGLDLVRAVCEPEGNLLLSPTSAAGALGLLHAAGDPDSAAGYSDVLHLPEWSDDLVAALREHTQALDRLRSDGDPHDEDALDSLQTSNRLWTAVGSRPEQDYLDDIATAFAADVRSLDFAGDPVGATDRINDTVADDTRGMIERLFDAPLGSDTTAVVTNAVHLKARWAHPFTFTRPAPFATPSGEATVDMMTGGKGTFRQVGGWQSVELPYRDGTLAAVAVLPPEGTDPCTVEAGTLAALEEAPGGPTDVSLPRMTIEQTHQLLDPLQELGLPTGPFPRLAVGDLVQVVQKTVLRVDEEGTEAAAATGGVVAVSAPARTTTFDRPFLFVLTDTATRSPLFTAVVRDPSAG